MSPQERVYWMVFTYGCSTCKHEIEFYLEVGCEGPKDHFIDAVLPKNHPVSPGKAIEIAYTRTNREVLPVPFFAGRCPRCAVGDLSHVRWEQDRELAPHLTEVHLPVGAARFVYPSRDERRRYGAQACGRPVYDRGEVAS